MNDGSLTSNLSALNNSLVMLQLFEQFLLHWFVGQSLLSKGRKYEYNPDVLLCYHLRSQHTRLVGWNFTIKYFFLIFNNYTWMDSSYFSDQASKTCCLKNAHHFRSIMFNKKDFLVYQKKEVLERCSIQLR